MRNELPARDSVPPRDHASGRGDLTVLGLEVDIRLTVIVLLSTMLLLVDEYHSPFGADVFGSNPRGLAAESVLLYLLIPVAVVVLLFRDPLRDYGFQFGDWRAGLKWTAIILLGLAPALYLAATTAEFRDYYAGSDRGVLDVILVSGTDLFAWEFLFRGFLLFGLYRAIGPSAIVLQAVPFAMAHIGKPELETMTTVIGGIGFGWIAWRTDSFIYPFLIHWGLNVFVRLVAMGG